MKALITITSLLVFISHIAHAQVLSIESGGLFIHEGSLIVDDISELSVNGTIKSGNNSQISFNSPNTNISGDGEIVAGNVLLNGNIDQHMEFQTLGDVLFLSGNWDIHEFNFYLGGNFVDEREESHMFASSGGEIITYFNVQTNQLNEPGVLGLSFYSSTTASNVEFRRSHKTLYNNGDKSIQRSFYFPSQSIKIEDPTFKYFDAELNGLKEDNIALFGSNDSLFWQRILLTGYDTYNNEFESSFTSNHKYFSLFPKNAKIIIPEGFSPNNDGINDAFEIIGLTENYPVNNITIYNRWGNKVFYASPYKNNWTGQNMYGLTLGDNSLSAGTYYYVLELPGNNNSYKGYVYLNRQQ